MWRGRRLSWLLLSKWIFILLDLCCKSSFSSLKSHFNFKPIVWSAVLLHTKMNCFSSDDSLLPICLAARSFKLTYNVAIAIQRNVPSSSRHYLIKRLYNNKFILLVSVNQRHVHFLDTNKICLVSNRLKIFFNFHQNFNQRSHVNLVW